jgi:hypothetical protein
MRVCLLVPYHKVSNNLFNLLRAIAIKLLTLSETQEEGLQGGKWAKQHFGEDATAVKPHLENTPIQMDTVVLQVVTVKT